MQFEYQTHAKVEPSLESRKQERQARVGFQLL